jgi:multidrug resistance efflux pump
MLNELRASATDKWIHSDNPIKKRVARLEVAWREGFDYLLDDVRKMFQNFAVISDAYDQLDVNTMVLKTLLIDKGVISEEEFQAKRQELLEMVARIREQKQKELEEAQRKAAEEEASAEAAEEAARVAEAERGATDGSTVDPELSRMRKAAEAAGQEVSYPTEAFRFGG